MSAFAETLTAKNSTEDKNSEKRNFFIIIKKDTAILIMAVSFIVGWRIPYIIGYVKRYFLALDKGIRMWCNTLVLNISF